MRPALQTILFGGMNLTRFFAGADGFAFDFTQGATGAGVASVSSQPPASGSASQGTGGQQPTWTAGAPGYANFDGIDDNLVTTVQAGAAATLIFCGRASAVSAGLMGASDSSSHRAYLALTSSGAVGGGVGSVNNATITGGASVVGKDFVAALTFDGAQVQLWANGVQLYLGAQSGVTPALAAVIGAVNGASGPTSFGGDRCYRAALVQRPLYANDLFHAQRLFAQGVPTLSF